MEHKPDHPELTWGSSAEEGAKLEAMWPTDETGARDKAVFLTHVPDFNNEADFAVNMLIAYGIPAFKTYNNEGSLGKLIIGTSAYGAALYVPASMAADAIALLESSSDAAAEAASAVEAVPSPGAYCRHGPGTVWRRSGSRLCMDIPHRLGADLISNERKETIWQATIWQSMKNGSTAMF